MSTTTFSSKRTQTMFRQRIAGSLVVALAALAFACSRPAPGTFATPEEAITTLSSLIGSGDTAKIEETFGPGSMEIFKSGDDVADKADGEKVKALIAEKVSFEDLDETTKIAVLGNDAWPLPIPLVKEGERWKFDLAAAKEEIANRRVGRNELMTIATLHALVDAQREYASVGRDGNAPAFAQRLLSSEGKHDGLYWPSAEGEPESPMGDLLAAASAEGYSLGSGEGAPYHGYKFKALTAQGEHAPGGARSYVDDKGLMTKGFAAVAWPAEPGESGVMTFIVSNGGIIYEKDLGAETEALASAMTTFDPDDTWDTTDEPDAIPEPVASAGAPAGG